MMSSIFRVILSLKANPRDMVKGISLSPILLLFFSILEITSDAALLSVFGKSMTNSSPPYLARISSALQDPFKTFARLLSKLSPSL